MRAILSHAISFGPLTVPGWLLLYIVALAASSLLARFLRAVDAEERRSSADLIMNAGTIWLLGWKLAPILLRPAVTFRDPLSVLATPGGTTGTLIGLGLAVAYLVSQFVRSRPGRRVLFQLAASVVGGGIAFFLGIAVLGIVLSSTDDESGRIAELTLTRLDGEEVSLSDYRGRTVLLNFWATWCPPCRAEIPDLVDFHAATAAETSAVLLSVNQTFSEPGRVAVEEFVSEMQIQYPVLMDSNGLASAAFGVRGIPTTFVIGPDGRITERAFGAVSTSWLNRFRE